MANMIDNLGLSVFLDTEEDAQSFVGLILSDPTKVLTGYTGKPVVRRTFKDAEFCVRTEPAENGKLEVCGIDTHCAGSCIWDTKVFSEMSYEEGDCNSRLLLVQKADGGGGAILNVINADVIPSYVCGDPLKVQVVGFPTVIDVFETEEEYDKAWAENYSGKAFKPAIGSIFPIGIMHRKDEKLPLRNGDENIICGRFKAAAKGNFNVGDEHKLKTFVRLIVATEFGELELEANRDMLPDSIAYDSIILASVVISADAAIYEYDDGIIRDEENDLRVLRQTIHSGEANRLKPILADNCIYTSEIGKWEKSGVSEIIELYKYIRDSREINYTTHMVTIANSDDISGEHEYRSGKKALLLENEIGEMESLMILEYNEEGMVNKIKVADAGKYNFVINKNYEKIEMPADEEKQGGNSHDTL